MDADTFIKRWSASSRNETAGSKPHFLELCALLDLPPPTEDPDGSVYAFEKAVAKANGRKGWADVWRRDCFGWEYKSKGRDLDAAHDQLLRYAGALGNPPLLITSDMARIVVKTNFTNTVTASIEYDLEALRDGSTRDRLRDCWVAPDRWRPGTTRQALTERAAGNFAELAERLRKRGHQAETVAHFVNRLVFCLFANDVRLLPAGMLGELLAIAQQEPSGFSEAASMLFRAMKEPGGRIGFRSVPWFNGGLFDDDTALPLLAEDIALLNKAAVNDWSQIDPSIFGTLFERGLDPSKRSQLGAHYTDRAKIELLVGAVVTRPLTAEWEATKAEITTKMDERAAVLKFAPAATEATLVLASADAVTAETQTARKDMRRAADRRTRKTATLLAESDGLYRGFLARLRAFRVLDPACGSGNFLYVSMLDLKNLELRVSVDAEAMGLEPSFPAIGPEAVLGIEINPYAAELARVSVWIGHIQWARRHGYPPPSNPVLRKLDTIECRDALLNEDGSEAHWPAADVLIGNPPFLGAKLMNSRLGSGATQRIRATFGDRLPGFTDLVCYWFEKARAQIAKGISLRAGFVATNSIAKNTNLPVLKRIHRDLVIFEAYRDETWTVDGAAVRVALVCFGHADVCAPSFLLDGQPVVSINPNLTTGTDISRANALRENRNRSLLGVQKSGPLDVPGDTARAWMRLPTNPNGHHNREVLKPYWNGDDVTGRPRDVWLIDLPRNLSEADASVFEAPFEYLRLVPYDPPDELRPLPLVRQGARDEHAKLRWWEPYWPRPEMRRLIQSVPRYIVTPETSEHRIFVWLSYPTLPDKNLIVFPRADEAFFGVLHSRFHEIWSTAIGNRMGQGNQRRYANTAIFDTYPFPLGLRPSDPVPDCSMDERAQAIAVVANRLDLLRGNWLRPPDLGHLEPEIAPGFPDRFLPASNYTVSDLKARTLTNLYNERPTWLDNLHRTLDAAVAAAYGWPADLSDDEVLARLLALNHERTDSAKLEP